MEPIFIDEIGLLKILAGFAFACLVCIISDIRSRDRQKKKEKVVIVSEQEVTFDMSVEGGIIRIKGGKAQ